jgi:hypothetical protein
MTTPKVVETLDVAVTPTVKQAARQHELGDPHQKFLLLTKRKLFGKPHEEEEEEEYRVYEYENGLVREGGGMPLPVPSLGPGQRCDTDDYR